MQHDCPVLQAIFLGFLRQFLSTAFQPTVDLKMYLNFRVNYKHTILITVTVVEIFKSNRAKHRKYTQCSCTIKRVFSCDNYMLRIFYVCEDFIQITLTNLQEHLQLHVINSKVMPVGQIVNEITIYATGQFQLKTRRQSWYLLDSDLLI